MFTEQGGRLALEGGDVAKKRAEAFLALRLLEQGHDQRAGGDPERGAHRGVHFLEAALVEGEELVDFEESAGFEKRFIKPPVALVEPPRGGFAEAVHQPGRHEKPALGFLRRQSAEGALVDERGGHGVLETLVLDAAAELRQDRKSA